MSAQTVSSCVVCGAMTDRFLCGSERHGSGCLGELLRQLGDCAALVDELNTVLSRQSKSGGMSIGFVTNGGDEQPLPVDAGALESGLLLRDRLGSWVRLLWEDNAPRDEGGWAGVPDVDKTITSLSRWLMRHPSWMALSLAADDLYGEIMETIRLAWASVDTAPGKTYIGQCSTVIEDWWKGAHDERPEGPAPQCSQELYAREGDWEKRCPVCSTIHDVQDRREILTSAVELQYVPQRVLIGLVNDRGERFTGSMFRNLRSRKRIVPWVRLGNGAEGASVFDRHGWLVRPWTADDVGLEPLYNVGRVLDVLTTGKYARVEAA